MVTANTISKESIDQIDMAFSCIASSAMTIKRLTGQILDCNGVGNEAGALVDALEHVASNIGYIADRELKKLGSPGCIGGAEDWILPPSLRSAEQQLEVGAHHG